MEINNIQQEKVFKIEEDCMYDREHMEYVPTMWLCGCCHVQVRKTDTICWHCRNKLIPKGNIAK